MICKRCLEEIVIGQACACGGHRRTLSDFHSPEEVVITPTIPIPEDIKKAIDENAKDYADIAAERIVSGDYNKFDKVAAIAAIIRDSLKKAPPVVLPESAEIQETLNEIKEVLGTGKCYIDNCKGCQWESEEAASILSRFAMKIRGTTLLPEYIMVDDEGRTYYKMTPEQVDKLQKLYDKVRKQGIDDK